MLSHDPDNTRLPPLSPPTNAALITLNWTWASIVSVTCRNETGKRLFALAPRGRDILA